MSNQDSPLPPLEPSQMSIIKAFQIPLATQSQPNIVMQRERPITKFNGDWQHLNRFEEEVSAYFEFNRLSEKGKRLVLLEHLGNSVRDELSCRDIGEKATAEEILRVLREVYVDPRPLGALEREFFTLAQEANQGVRDFSHTLKRKYDHLVERQRKAGSPPWPQRNLREQFVEGLVEVLRTRVEDYLLDHPDIDFLAIRERALVYEQREKGKEKAVHVQHLHAEPSSFVQPTDPVLLQVLTNQNSQIEHLTQELKTLQHRFEEAVQDRMYHPPSQDPAPAQRPVEVFSGSATVTQDHRRAKRRRRRRRRRK